MTDYYSIIPNFNKEIPIFLDQSNQFVIIGIENNSDSLGYKIFKALKNTFNIFPIGTKNYAEIAQINQNIDAAIITTDSKETLTACQECFKNDILNIWIEAGSESKNALDFCKKNKINVIYMHSILKERINPSAKNQFKKDS